MATISGRAAARHSLLLALEPRQVFDAAVGAAVAEVLNADPAHDDATQNADSDGTNNDEDTNGSSTADGETFVSRTPTGPDSPTGEFDDLVAGLAQRGRHIVIGAVALDRAAAVDQQHGAGDLASSATCTAWPSPK